MKIYKIVKSSQLSYEKTQEFIDLRDEQYQKILQEYYDKKRKKESMMNWDVIPFARLKKIWEDYIKTGIVRDEIGMQAITDQMIRILARLNASTDLSGHSDITDEEIKDLTGYDPPKGDDLDFYWKFLETEYGTPVSDYGLPKLNEIASNLMMARNSIEQLLLVDQMLNIVHQRGDLAALFIEGGSKSLSQLAGSI